MGADWRAFPFVRFACSAILGVLSYFQLIQRVESEVIFYTLSGVFAVLLVALRFRRKLPLRTFRLASGMSGLLLIFMTFVWITHLQHQKLKESGQIPPDVVGYEVKILSEAHHTNKTHRYVARIERWIGDSLQIASQARMYLYLPKTDSIQLLIGERFRLVGSPDQITSPTTPGAFDFAAYAERQGIHFSDFASVSNLTALDVGTYTLIDYFRLWNADVYLRLGNNFSHQETLEIAGALLLGRKADVSEFVHRAYADSGTLHLLAVSGLHVGIWYLLLYQLFTSGDKTPLRLGAAVLIIIGLWAYAVFTGWSPSVIRAATMFSVVALGQGLRRSSSIYNSLGLAAVLMLTINPLVVYEVGFQLSFLAVFGIVYYVPIWTSWWMPKSSWLKKVWQLVLVSLAAQLVTLPLSIFYFHSFPTYGLLANLLAVPLTTILLPAGLMLVLLLYLMPFAAIYWGWLVEQGFWLLNGWVSWIQSLPGNVWTNLQLTQAQVLAIYVWLLLGSLALFLKRSAYIWVGLIFGVLLLVDKQIQDKRNTRIHQLHLYPDRSGPVLGYFKGERTQIRHLNKLSEDTKEYHVLAHLRNERRDLFYESVPFDSVVENLHAARVGEVNVLLLNGPLLTYRPSRQLSCNLLIVDRRAITNLEWLETHIQFDELILGMNHSRRYENWFLAESKTRGWKVHSLTQHGYWEKAY